MPGDSTDILYIVLVAGAMAVALICVWIALRATRGKDGESGRWKTRAVDLDRKLARVDSIFGSYPGLIMVWDSIDGLADTSEANWGQPRTFGSAAALASLVRFTQGRPEADFASRVLDALADRETVNAGQTGETLRQNLARLRQDGIPFSITVLMPKGETLEVDGRVAGAQVVLWVEDASVRRQDEQEAITRFQKDKLTASSDPVAFVEIMNKAPFPIWRFNAGGTLAWANENYVTAVGADSLHSVLANQTYLDDDCVRESKFVLSTFEAVDAVRHVVVDGARRSLSIKHFPLSGGVAGMAFDATDAERYRDTLTRHIRAHDKLLDSLGEAIVIFGADQKMSFHNTAFSQMFELDENWFRDRPSHGEWLDHLREKRRLPEQSDYRDFKSRELALYTNWPDEMPDELWSMPDGRTLRLVRMRDPRGGLSLLFGDMTDQMTLQSQYNTLIGVQSVTLDKLKEGIAVFGSNGRLKIHNAAFGSIWGLSAETLKDNPTYRSLIDQSLKFYHDKEFWADMQARTTDPSPETRRVVSGEITCSDGRIMTWFSRPLPDGATLVVWDDVTAARQSEEALIERAEALEQADRLKSEFVGHVSYQLRTPLTTISGYADFLQSGAAGEMTDKQSEYIFAIQSASGDLKKSIDDILDIAAIEANVLDLDLGDVEIYAALETSLDYVATKAEDTKVSMQLKCPKNIGKIRADERRLKQIVYNLLSNALRFTKPGGFIELGAERVEDGIMLWVKDNGVGIPTERQPQVFESFRSSRGGTGLGLALVQRFVERHGGWVDLESEEGMGTHVTVYLPESASVDGAHPELDL